MFPRRMRAPAKLARFRAPAIVHLQRAQMTLMLATLVPTVLMLALGIVMLAVGSGGVNLVSGLLLLAFCTTSLTGYILGSIFVSRGASLAKVQNDFVSSVSHELRTPLTSIRMFIETLQDERLTDAEEKQRCLDLLLREVERLDGLVTRVIDLSRFETGRHPFVMERVSVEEVVQDALQAFDAATLSAPNKVEVAIEPEAFVSADRASLSLALTNLLMNAYKYGGARARIRVEGTVEDRGHVHITVSDDGPGIPKDEQRQIFEEFERGSGAIRGRAGGSGLGLAIVRAVIKAHGGTVLLDSVPGQGAAFTLRLKRATKGEG